MNDYWSLFAPSTDACFSFAVFALAFAIFVFQNTTRLSRIYPFIRFPYPFAVRQYPAPLDWQVDCDLKTNFEITSRNSRFTTNFTSRF